MAEWYDTHPDTVKTRLEYLGVTPGTRAYSKAIVVDSTGGIDALDVTALSIGGVDKSNAVIGVASGYKIARGEGSLDGSNPTPVAHGLTSCVSFTATYKSTAAPGGALSFLTANINSSVVDVYAWKPTSTADTTLVASTSTGGFYWIGVGV